MNTSWKHMSDQELRQAIHDALAELARRSAPQAVMSEDLEHAAEMLSRALEDGGKEAAASFADLSEDASIDVADALTQATRAERETGLAPRSIIIERAERGWVARLADRGIRVEAPSAAQAARSLRSSLRAV